MLSLNSQRQPRRRQLHKQILEEVKQNLHLLGSNVGTQFADEEGEGEAGAAEEGEVLLANDSVNRSLMLDYIIYWRFNHNTVYRQCLPLFSFGSQER